MTRVIVTKRSIERILHHLWVWVALLAVWGCASANFGRLAHDDDVTRMFTKNSVPPEYSYYTNGRSQMPYAIIGLRPEFPQSPLTWQPVTPNSQDFADKVRFVYIPTIWDKLDPPRGAWVLDPAGNRIGVWYSMYPWTTIKEKDGAITVFSPFVPTGVE